MSTIEHVPPHRPPCARPCGGGADAVRGDPLPQRGGEHRPRSSALARDVLRREGISGEVIVADNASEDRSRRARRRGRRPRRARAAPRLRQRLPRRLRRRPRQVHRHGRRRPHVRLQRDPALRRAARRRRRPGHGRPDGQHPARRDALAAPLRRQPDPQRHPEPLLQAPASATRTAACAACAATSLPRLDLRTPGMEFASEMVIRASKERLDIREFPIEYHPRGGESQALELPRRLAPPALPAGAQPDAPLHDPRRRDHGARRAHRADGPAAGRHPRPHLGPAHDDRAAAC